MIEVGIFLIGAIIVVGFFGSLLFERTKVPDVLLLMLLGVLLGPVFKIVDPAYLTGLAPFFGALALVIILFDGGLSLNIVRVAGEFAQSAAFTVTVFIATVAAVAGATTSFFGWPLLNGLLVGAILGGTASNLVIPLLNRVNAGADARTFLSLESALNDALTIVMAVTLTQVIVSNTVDANGVFNSILGAFSIAALLGAAAGIFWMKVLRNLYERNFGYMLTLATLFMLYGVAEAAKSSGSIAVLVFGLIIGNSALLDRWIGGKRSQKNSSETHDIVKAFHLEVSFFVRTFFFVYLGTIFSIGSLSPQNILLAGAIFIALIAARYLSVAGFATLYRPMERFRKLAIVVMPRGLAAAALASYPASKGVNIPNLSEIIFLIIFLTSALATAGIFLIERESAAPSRPRIIRTG